MKYLISFIIFCVSSLIYSQCGDRYQDEIFSSVSINSVNYSDVYNDVRHQMDIYTPNNDTVTNRPVIFYMHGGGFSSGDKNLLDCIDFCTYYAKRGYVAISANYRLSSNTFQFALSQQLQYSTVFEAVADIKGAIRYVRKNHDTGNSLGIDPNSIFIGGYSAGAVLSIHLAYIDQVSELPTSPIDVQAIVNNLGGIEGDAGNNGYSSSVNGVFSFAGGINDLNWIDSNDEPLVSVHGTDDLTVNFNCGPGLNVPTVLTLCGAGETHPKADAVGLLNAVTVIPNEGHNWAAFGGFDSNFLNALDFTKSFFFPLLNCNQNLDLKNNLNFELKQYPNPTISTVNYESNQIITTIELFNSFGQKVNSYIVDNNSYKIDVSNFSKGIYTAKINFSESKQLFKKLIVNN